MTLKNTQVKTPYLRYIIIIISVHIDLVTKHNIITEILIFFPNYYPYQQYFSRLVYKTSYINELLFCFTFVLFIECVSYFSLGEELRYFQFA